MFRPRISGSHFNVRDYDLPKDQVDWLEGVLGEEPTLRTINDALSKPAYTQAQRRILESLRDSVNGPLRLTPGVVFTNDGPTDIEKTKKVWNLRGATVPVRPGLVGKSANVNEFREALAPYLVGQEHVMPEMHKMAKAFDSPTQLGSPVMVIAGPKSHGKEQALEGFAKAFFGENATVLSVDLSRVTDDDVDRWFEEGANGELSTWALQEIEDRKKGVVHLTGLDDLLTRAPKFADTLFKLLSRQRDDQGYARVHFFLDFDFNPDDEKAEKNPLALLKKALGASARYLPSAKAIFDRLNAEAMLQYAAGAMEEFRSKPGLGQLVLEWDEDAKDVLGRILATPYQPLDEVKARIRNLVYAQLEARDDTPADAVIRVHLSPHLATNPTTLDHRVNSLHEEDADTINVDDIFVVRIEGIKADDEARAELLEHAHQLVETTVQLVSQLSQQEERYAPEYGFTQQLLEQLASTAELLTSASGALKGSKRVRSTPEQIGKELAAQTADTEDTLKQLGSSGVTRLKALGIDLDPRVAKATKTALETALLTSSGLRDKNGKPAPQESLDRFADNALSLASTINDCRARLEKANQETLASSLLTRFDRLAGKLERAITVSEERAKEDVFPLLMRSEAEELLASINAVREALKEASANKGPSGTLVAAMRAAGAKNVLPSILDRMEKIATSLGDLAKEDRITIRELYTKESSDSPKMRRDIAKRLIRTENGANDDDARIAMAELVKIPLRVLKRLDRNKIPVVVIRGKMTDYLKMSDEEKKTRPPGYPEGKSYDDVPAIFTTRKVDDEETSEVIIVTADKGGRRVIPGIEEKKGHNSVIHEVMHAFDKNGVISQKPEWLKIIDAELSTLTPYEKQGVEDLGDRKFNRGASEAWAITGERLYGGDDTVRAEREQMVKYLESLTKDDKELGEGDDEGDDE